MVYKTIIVLGRICFVSRCIVYIKVWLRENGYARSMGIWVMIDDKRCIADAKKCPLCGQPNNCEVDRGSDCWCFSETFSKELLLDTEVLSTKGLKAKALGCQVLNITKESTIYKERPTKACVCQCCVRGFSS